MNNLDVFLMAVPVALIITAIIMDSIKQKICNHKRFEKIAEREIYDQYLNKTTEVKLKCTDCGEISFKEIKHD